MGNVEIYWFSGTGNSLAIARELAGKIGAELKPLAPLITAKTINSTAEAIGLVFPVYDFKAPAIIEDFFTKFAELENKYLFVVCTYGISPLKCLSRLQSQLAARGIDLQAGFSVMMPHNAVGNTSFSKVDRDRILANGKKRINKIARVINNRQITCVETESLMSALFFRGLFFKVIKPVIPLLLYAARYGWDSLAFQVNDRCSGCAICSKVCPVNNVVMDQDRPVWGTNCLSCFACLQWCPREAIQIGTGQIRVDHYHHPEIKFSDLIYTE
ncbi:MAG: EFR1 family ferrodoxin [Bacillota bacterium]